MDLQRIIFIHEFLVNYFDTSEDPVSPPGIRDQDLLESAVKRPFMSVGGADAYKGIFKKSAALFHSLINNHGFHNGNKRVALLSTIVFLGEERWWITLSDQELFDFTMHAANHTLCSDRKDELECISEFFRVNTRKRKAGEHSLSYRELKEILVNFGFELVEGNNRTKAIRKNGKVITTILKKGAKGQEDYDKQYINKLRRKLELTPEFGVDSYDFYGARGFTDTLGTYMRMRDNVMRELAKL